MNEKPNYYSIIPAHIRYDEKLTPNAKLLYAEITSLTNKEGVCWASDQYFMKLYEVKKNSIQRWLKQLEQGGHISRKTIYKKGSKEIEKRLITLQSIKIQGYTQKRYEGSINKDTDNTTSINTTSNNKVHGRFEEFYNLYPKKIARQRAETAFKNAVKDLETLKLILNDLEKRKGHEQWYKDEGKYIPHPATYLNGAMWLDEYEIKEVDNHEKVRRDYANIKPKD